MLLSAIMEQSFFSHVFNYMIMTLTNRTDSILFEFDYDDDIR